MIQLIDLLKENIDNDAIWYHGTDKIWDTPKKTVGEFNNIGGFFISKNIEFARKWGKIIKGYKLKPDTKIFDIDNEDDLLKYAEQVKKQFPIPNLGILHYAIILLGDSSLDNIKYILKIAYPDIKNNIFNTIMDEPGNKYDNIQYIIRKKRLYHDYQSIEENDATIMKAGFDGAYIWENKNKNIQLYNLSKLIPITPSNQSSFI